MVDPAQTLSAWKRAVAQAFDRAEDYERAACIQARVAEGLAATIAREPLPAFPRTLEVGCGTGLLTRALRERASIGAMLVTDIAPAMLQRCRARFGSADDLHFAVMDGERPSVAFGFDLIASSLAAQWFGDLEAALQQLAGLLRPRGLLAVTTLAAGTFREWHEAQHGLPLRSQAAGYPSVDSLRAMRFAGCTSEIRLDHLTERHPDGAAFLHGLRTIGADTPADPTSIRSAGALRRALRTFDAQGASVTYVVATCLIRRSEPSGP